jgi:ATP-dependent Clp protease ATP-binding subunit ClpA
LAIRTFENIGADFTRDRLEIRVSCEDTVGVYERMTEQGRAVIDGAHVAAQRLGHDYVGTEHVLLALTRTPCAARRILESLGLSEQRVHAKVVELIGVGTPSATPAAVPTALTAPAQRVLDRSHTEARDLGHAHTDAEHILLALAHDPSGAALLSELGVDEGDVQAAIARHHQARPAPEPPPPAALRTTG